MGLQDYSMCSNHIRHTLKRDFGVSMTSKLNRIWVKFSTKKNKEVQQCSMSKPLGCNISYQEWTDIIIASFISISELTMHVI